ncbi:UvrD-helicase domain-containing protein, partial [Candidatus Riflebacteria bacterium]
MKLIIDQVRSQALAFDKNTIVCSGAGSGKTTLIVMHYLNCLEKLQCISDGFEAQHILAITFTEKAASELRGRIRQQILAKIREYESQGENNAKVRWQRIFRNIDHAYIGTIHSMCRRFLTEFSFEIKIDPAFSVIDEKKTRRVLIEFVEKYLKENLQEYKFLKKLGSIYPLYQNLNWQNALVPLVVDNYIQLKQDVAVFLKEMEFSSFCEQYQFSSVTMK